MAKKAASKQKQQTVKSTSKSSNIFDYLRFGESYTSLVLGIIVVIIATALLLSFIHNKNAGNVNAPISEQTQNTVQVSQQASDLAKKAPSNAVDNVATITPTFAPTKIPVVTSKPVPTVKPTAAPQPKKAVIAVIHPTVKPTELPKPTRTPQKIVMVYKTRTVSVKVHTAKRKSMAKPTTYTDKNVWIVQKGDSLWTIAQEKYGSGYNWTDIAKANNLAIPSDIHVGDRLVLPSVTPQITTIAVSKPTVSTNDEQYSSTKQTNSIAGSTYTVVHGDNLWNIAVRAYGDGYRWVAIEKANGLTNPGMIFSGNVLTIPR